MTLESTVAAVLDRRLLPSGPAPIVLGLSGGGDSLALMLLAKHWADAHGRRLSALTVDHRLHPDSLHWTAFAGEAAARAGIEWRSLAWTGAKPAAGLPAAARAARHRLLAEAAREAGASVILLGHTADDLAEAALMRERDAPALGAPREWGPSPVWPEGRGVFLLRPLLDVGRMELREWLAARGWTWLDDPANEDQRFARARARRRLKNAALTPLAGGNTEGGSPEGAASAPPAPALPRERGRRTATRDGRIIVQRGGLSARFVSAALLCAGGGETPPRGERLSHLVERLAAGEVFTASLAGARVTASANEVVFGREAGERARGGLAAVPLEAGRAAVWDGRYEVVTGEAGWRVEALAGRVGALSKGERAWLKTLPPAARSALPVLVSGGSVVLPQPFGDGPAVATSLVETRLDAACGLLDREEPRPS